MDFKPGELIWAKMRGYPHWPARIDLPAENEKIPAKWFPIFFFGSHETAVMKGKHLCGYEKYKAKYAKSSSRRFFNEALEEIVKDPKIRYGQRGEPVEESSESEDENDKEDDEEEDAEEEAELKAKKVAHYSFRQNCRLQRKHKSRSDSECKTHSKKKKISNQEELESIFNAEESESEESSESEPEEYVPEDTTKPKKSAPVKKQPNNKTPANKTKKSKQMISSDENNDDDVEVLKMSIIVNKSKLKVCFTSQHGPVSFQLI